MLSQPSWAHAPVAWAMSPTTVIEPLRDRRSSIRRSIGERSWISSTTMWPYVRTESSSLLPGRGPSTARASSRSVASDADQRMSSGRGTPGRYSESTSSSVRAGSAARSSALEPNRSLSSWAGLNTGHIHSSASRMTGSPRNRSLSPSGSRSLRPLSANAVKNSASTNRRAALWVRKRRRASVTMRLVTDVDTVSHCRPWPTRTSSRNGRWRVRTARETRRTMRRSPLRRDTASTSRRSSMRTPPTMSPRVANCTPASPRDGSTCSM